MAVDNTMDPLSWLRKHLEAHGGDLLREMVQEFAEQLMAAEAQAMCGAGYGEVSPERVNARNGYRSRVLDTRTGTMELKVPKLRRGSYLPDWLSYMASSMSAASVSIRHLTDARLGPQRPFRYASGYLTAERRAAAARPAARTPPGAAAFRRRRRGPHRTR